MAAREYDDPASRPLFGETQRQDRLCNLVVASLTGIMVAVTLVSAFVFPKWPPNGINILFAAVMLLIGFSHLLLNILTALQQWLFMDTAIFGLMIIYWYRQGDLEPKFLRMIFYNAFTMILLCVCGNLYIHNVDTRAKR